MFNSYANSKYTYYYIYRFGILADRACTRFIYGPLIDTNQISKKQKKKTNEKEQKTILQSLPY